MGPRRNDANDGRFGVGRRVVQWSCGALFLAAAVFYFAMPFSVNVSPISTRGFPFGGAQQQDIVRADCSGPWRQLVSQPSMHTGLGTGSKTFIVQHNRQPLCANTGRSRAIVSAWLLAAALAFELLARSEPGLNASTVDDDAAARLTEDDAARPPAPG